MTVTVVQRETTKIRFFAVATFAVFAILFGSLGWIVSRLVGDALTGENVWAGRWRHGVAWPLVVLTAALVPRFLIQYAGDVDAYVQPHVLDRFYEVRQKIKDSVWRTAHAVYGAREIRRCDLGRAFARLGSRVRRPEPAPAR